MKLTARVRAVRGELSLTNARRRWRERRGLHFEVRDSDGAIGEGEASPLPGYSPDDLPRVRAELEALRELDVDPADPLAALPPLGPAASFAAEVALLDWQARREGVPFHALLPRRHEQLPLAALVPFADGLPSAERLLAQGIGTLKLKIGRDLDAELALARTLSDRGARLRFDANGALPPARVPALIDSLVSLDAEMLEEPCPGPWPTDAPIPLAVDESLFHEPSEALARLERREARRVLLKPTCLGGPRRIAALSAAVADLGGECLFSHTFGGPLERAAVGALALAYGSAAPVGLGAHPGLAVWPAARDDAFGASELRRGEGLGLGVEWAAPWTR